MAGNDTTALAVTGCYVCSEKGGLKDCVGCGQKVCGGNRGAGGNDYRNASDQEGYACHKCVEQGKAFERGLGASINRVGIAMERIGAATDQIRTSVASLGSDLLPLVMVEVDKRMPVIQKQMVDPTVEKLIDAIDGRIDKLTEAVEQLHPRRLIWQVGLVVLVVNLAIKIATVLIAKHL